MIKVKVIFKNGSEAVFKSRLTCKQIMMCSVGQDFFVRNKEKHELVKKCVDVAFFYRTGINDQLAHQYFGATVTESFIDGRTLECKGLPYYSIQHLVNNLTL